MSLPLYATPTYRIARASGSTTARPHRRKSDHDQRKPSAMADTADQGRNAAVGPDRMLLDPGRQNEIRSLTRRTFAARYGAARGAAGRGAKRRFGLRHGSRQSKRL